MRGLDSRYKFHVRATNPVTLADAVNTAKGFELSYNELATQPIGIVQNNNKEIVALLGEMQKQISTWGNQNQASNSNNNRGNQWSNNNNNNRSNTNSFAGDCHNCGKRGHMAKDCWSKRNNNNGNNNRPNNRGNGNWRNNSNQGNNNNNRNSNNSNNNRSYHFNDSELADYIKAIMKENKDLKD
jgi:hypothetical protein